MLGFRVLGFRVLGFGFYGLNELIESLQHFNLQQKSVLGS